MSLRQFEALTTYADIIACEDTRKTGKMLELILDRKMKGKFKSAFGTEFETFFDSDEKAEPEKPKEPEAAVDDHKFDADILFENSADDRVL
jgi:16S rRNA C1402 (ribose-2'-O) methylase RsmI